MNLSYPLLAPSKLLYRIGMKCRRLLPRTRSQTFGPSNPKERPRIERIYVINLDRQPDRWVEMGRELRHVLDSSGAELGNLTERYPAVDAGAFAQHRSTTTTSILSIRSEISSSWSPNRAPYPTD